jgi:hypothetical protein
VYGFAVGKRDLQPVAICAGEKSEQTCDFGVYECEFHSRADHSFVRISIQNRRDVQAAEAVTKWASSLSDLRKNKGVEAILISKQTVVKPYHEGVEE